MRLSLSRLSSPLGPMLLVTDEAQVVRALDFAENSAHVRRNLTKRYEANEVFEGQAPTEVVDAIEAYFAGELDALHSLRVQPAGSVLQRKVWSALREIPVGLTVSYRRLANIVGFDDARAAIAVGAANAANPIAIIVPCHRVIASNGDLKGYAWGRDRKRWLLEHEKAILPQAKDRHLGFP